MKYVLYYKKDNKLKFVTRVNVMRDLYEQKASLPTPEQVKKSKDKDITGYFKKHSIDDLKLAISEIDDYVPLYDQITKNLYILDKNQVYNRVTKNHYRFPDIDLRTILKNKMDVLGSEIKKVGKGETDYEQLSKVREYRKLNLMLKFLNSFDLKTLKNTYINVFYNYANEVGKNMTVCLKPSFRPYFSHLEPFYTRSELINLGLNMGIIKPDKKYYDSTELMKLCDRVKKNDISAKTILEHQKHIVNKHMIGLVQYYTLQGSFFMNQYLRGFTDYKFKNPYLEKNIKAMYDLVSSAPKFDKDYTLYRFIKDDPHLINLSVGDTINTKSFLSTTRDPFYRSEEYKFGFILLKIKIPANKVGIALCIETLSNFPKEQEILIPPGTVMKLEQKDTNVPYFHTDDFYKSQFKRRYEFTIVDKSDFEFARRPSYDPGLKLVDFVKEKPIDVLSVEERIKNFLATYSFPFYQFKTLIGGKEYTIYIERYDSTSVYKDFYAVKTNNGFMLYMLIGGYIGFTIEIGEADGESYMYVNYYFRYSTKGKSDITREDFILFLSAVGHYFNIRNVVIFSDYTNCDILEGSKRRYYGGNFCQDYYQYLKSGKKRFSGFDTMELKPKFSYYQLDRLKETSPVDINSRVIRKTDQDEIYQIYKDSFKKVAGKDNDNLAAFYIWMIENHCVFVEKNLVPKMERLFKENNPFRSDYYLLDAFAYMYNKNYITTYPTEDSTSLSSPTRAISKVPKNTYRLGRGNNNVREI